MAKLSQNTHEKLINFKISHEKEISTLYKYKLVLVAEDITACEEYM